MIVFNDIKIKMKRTLSITILLIYILFITGCSTNPVTGKRELSLVSESQELALGAKQYQPSRQSQGGDYTADPQLVAYIRQVGQKLAAVSDRKLPYEFNIINDSIPNAWALPGGKIALNRGLLTELKSESELAAVLGHEIVHAAAKHGAKSMSRGILAQGLLLGTQIALHNTSYGNMVVGAAQVGAALTQTKYGRDAERESDYYGTKYMARAGYDPYASVTLQETFVRLSKGKKSGWIEGLLASHPPSQERVDNNKKLVAELNIQNGFVGREVFRQKMAHLNHALPAYKAYDRGLKALKDKQYSSALSLAKEAIKIEPKEALFYALKADALSATGNNKAAKVSLNQALGLNPDYYHFYLQRGLLNEKLGASFAAQQDLKKSVTLLPTAGAYYQLGLISQQSGNQQQAVQFYKKAADGQSALSQKAAQSMLQLDLAKHPNRYIQTRLGLNQQGYLIVEVYNATRFNLKQIELVIKQSHDYSQGRSKVLSVLRAGQRKQISTPIGPTNTQGLMTYKVQIKSAQLVK